MGRREQGGWPHTRARTRLKCTAPRALTGTIGCGRRFDVSAKALGNCPLYMGMKLWRRPYTRRPRWLRLKAQEAARRRTGLTSRGFDQFRRWPVRVAVRTVQAGARNAWRTFAAWAVDCNRLSTCCPASGYLLHDAESEEGHRFAIVHQTRLPFLGSRDAVPGAAEVQAMHSQAAAVVET